MILNKVTYTEKPSLTYYDIVVENFKQQESDILECQKIRHNWNKKKRDIMIVIIKIIAWDGWSSSTRSNLLCLTIQVGSEDKNLVLILCKEIGTQQLAQIVALIFHPSIKFRWDLEKKHKN